MLRRTIEHLVSPRSVATFVAVGSFAIGVWALGNGAVDSLRYSLQQQTIPSRSFEKMPNQQDYANVKMTMGALLITSCGATVSVMTRD